MKTALSIALYLWQLPQNLLGLMLAFIYKHDEKFNYNFSVVRECLDFPGGISLGRYIFVRRWDYDMVKHEYGHTLQSIALGPLYLIVIGLPSLLWAKYCGNRDYYLFYTEKWADKWGGVER